MHTIAVRRDFIAQHYLIGGDWGSENSTHAHHYQIELQLGGQELDRHGYLVDIVQIEKALDTVIARYRDQVLNQLVEFEGLNPSIEHFSRIICQRLSAYIHGSNLESMTVKLWENEYAWASFQQILTSNTQ